MEEQMIRIQQLKIRPGQTPEQNRKELMNKCGKLLRIKPEAIRTLTIVKESIDTRKKPDIFLVYVVDVQIDEEDRILKKSKIKMSRL